MLRRSSPRVTASRSKPLDPRPEPDVHRGRVLRLKPAHRSSTRGSGALTRSSSICRAKAPGSARVLSASWPRRALCARSADRSSAPSPGRSRPTETKSRVAGNGLPRLLESPSERKRPPSSSSSTADRVFSTRRSASSRCALGVPSCSISSPKLEIIRSCSARIRAARSSSLFRALLFSILLSRC